LISSGGAIFGTPFKKSFTPLLFRSSSRALIFPNLLGEICNLSRTSSLLYHLFPFPILRTLSSQLEIHPFDLFVVHQILALALQAYFPMLEDIHPFHQI
jgi:hypothetical protein